MKKIYLALLFLILVPASVFAQTKSSNQTQAAKKKAVYFYNESCLHCQKVNDYFTANGIYNEYDIKKYETSDPKNVEYLNQFFDALGVQPDKRGWPVIFFDDKMLIGDQDIIGNFVKDMNVADASRFPTPDSIKTDMQKANQPMPAKKPLPNVPIPLLISAAFVDASNPCALAVLILLLATVIAAGGRRRALLSGLAFSLAIFASYFLMGVGLYKAITAFSLPKYISLAIGILSILIGLANMKDVFWYGKYFVMEVPLSWRPKMQSILKKVASPIGALGAGFVVSLFLVPCSSGPYVVILGLLAERVNTGRTLSLLVLYNFVFVLPMLIITLAMYFGSKMGKLEHWRKKNLRILHLVAGAVMLFIGAYLIYSWL